MVTDTLSVSGHELEVVYLTIYVPTVLKERSMVPSPEFMISPEVLVNVPPVFPLIFGVGSASFTQ